MPETRHEALAVGKATLELGHLQPVAKGGSRLIYEHPHDPGSLNKVARVDRLRMRSWSRQWLSGLSPEACFRRRALREVDEFLALYLHCGDVPAFVAPSLGDIAKREGPTGTVREQLQRFLDLLVSADLIANDLRPANIGASRCGLTRPASRPSSQPAVPPGASRGAWRQGRN